MNSCFKYKHYINAIFFSVYMFAAFFSSRFHQHQHLNHQIDFAKKVYQKGELNQEFANCYSCHLLHSNLTTPPLTFYIEFINFEDLERHNTLWIDSAFNIHPPLLNSRGPPVSNSI